MSVKPLPAQLPTWDTSLANTIALTGTHQTNGFVTNEIPTSGEANTLFAFLYLWCKYLSDGDLTGNLTASSVSENANTSVVQFKDYKGQYRTGFDHLGFQAGQYSHWDEHWRTASTTSPPGWTPTVVAAGTATMTDPTSTFKQRYVALQAGSASGNGITLTPEYVGFMDNGLSIEMDFMTEISGLSSADVFSLGLQFSGNSGTDFVLFYVNNTLNWQCRSTVNGTPTDTDSGIAVSTNPTRFRIEAIGSNNTSQAAGTFQYRYYINGALAITKNLSTIVSNKFRPYLRAFSNNTLPNNIHVGRIRVQFNHVLASDVL